MVILLGVVGLALSITLMSCLSMKKAPPELLTYSEEVSVSGVSSDDLFTKINLWVTGILKETNAKIETSNKTQGVIKATHTFWTSYGNSLGDKQGIKTLVYTTVTIEVKDGAYHILFSDSRWQARHADTSLGNNGWTKFAPLDMNYLDVTRTVWLDIAANLRSTTSGSLVEK
jgi:hypothetical protein